jgi:hypothetical protein
LSTALGREVPEVPPGLAAAHPPPWRWRAGAFYDGDGNRIVFASGGSVYVLDQVRPFIEAAGELAARLRDLTLRAGALLEQAHVDIGPVPEDDEDLVAILACEELLARIDERAKGGT